MAVQHYHPTRLFTAELANSMLPLVRAITADIVRCAKELSERRQRVKSLQNAGKGKPGDVYSDELSQAVKALEKDEASLDEYVTELLRLGVELKSPIEGLVDFPTMIDGKPALLCWKLGEPSVLFWHDLESGFSGRQPITPDTVCDVDSDPSDMGDPFEP